MERGLTKPVPSTVSKVITVLSIDGGGIRGIIPGVILEFLEAELQDETLTGTLSSVDVSTEKNLNDLVEVGNQLLKKPVSRVNLVTGQFETVGDETNEQAIKRLAKILSKEKKARAAKAKSSASV